MKIAPDYFTFVDRPLFGVKTLGMIAIILLFFSFLLLAVSLPRSVGRINDFANLLSIEDRKDIQGWMEPISERGLQLTILASRRDPYSDPDKYFGEIREKWDVEGGFILFVKEGEGWKTVSFLGQKIRAVLRSKGLLDDYLEKIEDRTANGEIRDAILFSVRRLSDAVTGEVKAEREKNGLDFSSFFALPLIVLGSFFVLFAFYGLLRWEVSRRCPECGVRMQVTKEDPYTGSSYRIISKQCRNCGYRETKRVKNTKFWPFGSR